MSHSNETKDLVDQEMELFFDFDGASCEISSMPMAGGDPASCQNERHRTDCRRSSAPTLVPLLDNSHCEDARQALGGELEPAELKSRVGSESSFPREFVTLREMEVLQQNVQRDASKSLQTIIHARQDDHLMKGASPLVFGSRSSDSQDLVNADSAVTTIESRPTSPLSGPGNPEDTTTLDQRKRKRSPLFDFLIPDILVGSPWTGSRRTEQEQRDRDEVIKAGGACLLCTFRHKKVSTLVIGLYRFSR